MQKRFSVWFTGFLSAFAILLLNPSAAHANVIGNASFESSIGNGVGGNWDSTNGAERVSSVGTFSAPPDGSFGLELEQGEFTFQTFDNVKPGNFVTFTAFAESNVTAGGGNGGQMKIEFKQVLSNGSDRLISSVTSTLITSSNAPNGSGFVRFTISGVAPERTGRVVFVLTREGNNAGTVFYDNTNGEVQPAHLRVSASKNRVKRGEIVTVLAEFNNASGDNLSNVSVYAKLDRGLDFVADSVRLNGQKVSYREGSLIIPVGSVTPGTIVNTSFQVLATSGTTPGKQYNIDFIVNNGNEISDRVLLRLIVEADPVFDEGTIIGKVFNDENQNTVQDKGEKGVPFVRLITEEGIIVITDEHGRYHIPAVKAGRHIVKIDGHTLPEGTKFISEESYLVRTTPGIINKANFAVLLPPSPVPVEYQKDLMVMVTQGVDTSRPLLEIQLTDPIVRAGLGVLEKEPHFKMQGNYMEYVKSWRIEVRDEFGNEIWTGLGISTPPTDVFWNGQTNTGTLVRPGVYSYQLKIVDHSDREDWTPLRFFHVVSKVDDNAKHKVLEIPPIGDFNIFQDGKQTIPLIAKPTLRIQGKTIIGNQVAINGQPVTVDPETGLFQMEIYTTPGEKEIIVNSTSIEGETISFRQKVKVKDSTFFMVALAEEQLGVNFVDGNLDSSGDDETLKEGFYEDGRLSYYLRGKLKGKFLVKSKFDTSDKRSALFTNLDPDNYYPIYGDASERNYEALGTNERFFMLVEMDRSFIKWGSFKTEFTDTELATYDRTLSGLKANYESVGTTPYGDPNRGAKLFWNKTQNLADHNEFAATGGSLYYLRNRRVVEGSEKLRVETRDKIQDIPIESYDLQEGRDYEIDYAEGRILLTRPLSSLAASDTLVTRDIIDGNPVYLIVDYEFDAPPESFENQNRGIRGYTQMGDHLRVGGTAVEEKRQNHDYDLRGVDAQLKIGRNTKINAEYAESINKQTANSISYNGGLSFRNASPIRGRRPREAGYLIKGQSKPVKNLETSAYLRNVEPGFSTSNIISQEGLKKYGAQAKYKFTESLYARYRYDSNNVVSQLRPLEERGFLAPFEKLDSHTAQLVYDDGKWLGVAEYLRQLYDIPVTNRRNSLLSEFPFDNAVSGKLGYRFVDNILPYVKVQSAISGKPDHQYGLGVRAEVAKNVFGYIEQMVGNIGDSTYFGFEKVREDGARSYLNLKSFDRGIGSKTLSTSIGSSYSLTEKSRVYSEREYSDYLSQDGYADILGYEGKINDRWDYDARYERRHLDGSQSRLLDNQADASFLRTNTSNTVYGGLGYAHSKKLRAKTSLEVRRDQDAPELLQWVTRNSLEYKINQDLSYLGRLDYGKSRFVDGNNIGTPANFMEFNTGFAYRPVEQDWLNILTRYTYIKNIANDLQFATDYLQALPSDEVAHIMAIDLAYDLGRYLGMANKFGYKLASYENSQTDEAYISTFLFVHRFNFHVTRKWDAALEYRGLWQFQTANSLRHGALVEVDREVYDYVRLGAGYNFTDFDDDLRKSNDYNSHGPFVRMTGKF